MKNKFIIMLLGLILCLSLSAVSADDSLDNMADLDQFDENNEIISDVVEDEGAVSDGNGPDINEEESVDAVIVSSNITKYFANDTQFSITLLDLEGAPLADRNVSFLIDGEVFSEITNADGIAVLKVDLYPGTYDVVTSFGNVSAINRISVLSYIISDDLVKYYKNDSQFIVRILDQQGNPLAGEKINITLNGVSYERKTNATGNAKFTVNLGVGNYTVTTTYGALSVNNTVRVLSVIDAPDLVKFYRNDSQFFFKCLDCQGNPFAGQKVKTNINGIIYNRTTNQSGLAKVNINLAPGMYIITVYYGDFAISSSIRVLSYIVGNDLVKYYKNDSQYFVQILDQQGSPLSGEKISLNINGVFYPRTTNESGWAKVNINLNPGDYVITTYFNNLAYSNNITIFSRFVQVTGDVTTIYEKWTPFKVQVLDNHGSVLKNEVVDFNVSGVTYSNTTDDEGVATLNLNLNAGFYGIFYSVAKDVMGFNLYTVKNQVNYAVMNWDDGGDVTKNEIIANNLPNSTLVAKLAELSKQGNPLVQVKGGDGKTVFMSSGVHGNELSSQVAMLRMINTLETTPINGTVYIAPFVCPQSTALNIRRYNGEDLNRIADKKGSPSCNLVELIVQFKCDAYGDFHTTQSPGVPGINVIMGVPTYSAESGKMAKAISEMTGFALDNVLLTSSEYYGSLAAQTSLKGIPGIISEVISVPGSMDVGSDVKSYAQIEGFLKYNGIL